MRPFEMQSEEQSSLKSKKSHQISDSNNYQSIDHLEKYVKCAKYIKAQQVVQEITKWATKQKNFITNNSNELGEGDNISGHQDCLIS